jgi:hypothetical protein
MGSGVDSRCTDAGIARSPFSCPIALMPLAMLRLADGAHLLPGRFSRRIGETGIHAVGNFRLTLVVEMAAKICVDADLRMPQSFHHVFAAESRSQQEGRAAVAQVMEPQPGIPSPSGVTWNRSISLRSCSSDPNCVGPGAALYV